MPEFHSALPAAPTNVAPHDGRSRLAALPLLASGWFWAVLVVGICWVLLFAELSEEWRINAEYSYGYVVPFLGLALLWRRWPDRPSARPGTSPLVAYSAVLLLLLLPAIRLVLQANPEWRLLYWLHGVQAVALSLCVLYRLGGGLWVGFFAAPLWFMLIAVPWPMGLEQWAVQDLMRQVAGLTVGLADGFGIPAVQHGNLIETSAGIVGIDEACSGVRSLQSALMLSLFLGELYRLPWGRRLGLVLGSLCLDLLANLTRTSFLVWAAADRGLRQMEAWHDTAGFLVMLIVLPSLLLLALLIRPRVQNHTSLGPGPSAPLNAAQIFGGHVGTHGTAVDRFQGIPCWICFLGIVWLGTGELASEAWYRLHETRLVANIAWSVVWPGHSPHFRRTAVPERALAILRCSDSQAASWEDEAGHQWSAFLLRWKPGKNSAQLAKGHRPDICFPASGARLVDDFGRVSLPAGGFEMPFRYQTFETGSTTVHVFYCLWPDRISPLEKPVLEDGSQTSRLLAVLAGKRHLGQRVLEIVISGVDSRSEALKLMRDNLPSLIRENPAK